MILTTTPSVEGETITSYLSIVHARSSDMSPATRSIIGVNGAMEKVIEDAEALGADAVVGIQFVGPTANYYDTIHIYGTAVKLK